jgi:integrase
MVRPKLETLSLRAHVSGQSFVRVDGRNIYLGRTGDPKTLARYAMFISDYQANGLIVPDGFNSRAVDDRAELLLSSAPLPDEHKEDEPLTVGHLCEKYKAHIAKRYSGDHQIQDLARKQRVVDDILETDSETLVEKFGPKKLKSLRQHWVDSGIISRKYANRLTNEAKSMFRWGVAEEIVQAAVVVALEALAPLQGGEAAYELDDRKAVPLDVVRATAAHLSPVVKAMVRLQVTTGMRPSEICVMRPMDIDRSGPVWFYRPPNHKTKHKGQKREIPLVGDARAVVEDYINRAADAFLFSPAEGMAWFRAKQRSERQSKVQPSQRDRRKTDPQKQPGDQYDSGSFRQAITRACKLAKVERWTPYQIRHLAGTVVAEALGLENAKALLGHSDIKTTQIYSKATTRQSIDAANALPCLGNE